MNSRNHILFFSRGKGRGHAGPDAAIAADLLAIRPDVRVEFVSYGTGATALQELGYETINLDLPENPAACEILAKAAGVLQARQPSLVVSHEEFSVVPLAKVAFGVPTVFLTDWFDSPDIAEMEGLKYADTIVFLDDMGCCVEPDYLKDKLQYVGTVFRDLTFGSESRANIRAHLGIATSAQVILVAPGGAECHSETRAPLFDLVIHAFDMLPVSGKRLLWVVGPHEEKLLERGSQRSDIAMLPPHKTFVSTLVAADLVITKGNRITLLECEAMHIPSLSISFGFNPIDDQRVERIKSNVALRAKDIDPEILARCITDIFNNGITVESTSPIDVFYARRAVAELLCTYLA